MEILITTVGIAIFSLMVVWGIRTLYGYFKEMMMEAKEEANDEKWNRLSEKQNRAWRKFHKDKKEREKDDEQ